MLMVTDFWTGPKGLCGFGKTMARACCVFWAATTRGAKEKYTRETNRQPAPALKPPAAPPRPAALPAKFVPWTGRLASPTHPYARDPAANAAAASSANPSADFSADGAAPTPTATLARGLFMPPRVTSQGVVAPPAVANTRSIASKRPQSAAANGSQKKSKANAGRGVKPPAAFQPPPPPPEAPPSSQFGAPPAAPNVFEEIPTRTKK
ncbi:branchpoint-bridging protein [Triticum aestivum]|uniref:branchpoint-bridging protein n=1 Tax=Triticum aestivum TaxID=4565 RepID=UPI001D0169F8|nr:branchpoint-bridging protein-like [Triticum aestivum]